MAEEAAASSATGGVRMRWRREDVGVAEGVRAPLLDRAGAVAL
jgi:hypothetical protein